MKLKRRYMRLPALLVTALLVFLTGCSRETENEARDIYTAGDESFNNIIRNLGEPYIAAENDGYSLVIDGTSAAVTVTDKKSGQSWSTNPENRKEDTVADGKWLEMLNAQLTLTYTRTSDGLSVDVNTYSDSLEREQVDYYQIKDGVGVHYLLGEEVKVSLYPTVLTEKRFEHFLANLNEDDAFALKMYYVRITKDSFTDKTERSLMIDRYPELANQALYVLSAATGTSVVSGSLLAKEIEELFAKAGYNAQELKKDQEENGIKADKVYDTSIDICIEYTLTQDGVSVTVPKDKILYDHSAIILTELTLLPYFGAADNTKNGYIFIPDGSGAIINLNNGKDSISAYKKSVYSEDGAVENGISENISDKDKTQILMPVYGIKEDNKVFLAVIEQGDEIAELNSDVSMKSSIYNYAYPSFTLKKSHVVTESVLNLSGNLVYQQTDYSSDITVNYLLMSGNIGYTDMALKYQEYLENKGAFKNITVSGSLPFYMHTIGSVVYKTTVAGIPVKRQKKLTSYSEAAQIASSLSDGGIQKIALGYEGWCNDGVYNSLFDGIDLIKVLGGSKEWENLVSYVNENGIDFYPMANLQYVYRNGLFDGFNANRDSAKNLVKNNAVVYESDYSFGDAENSLYKWVISPARYANILLGFLNELDSGISGLDLMTMSNHINSDYSDKKIIDRAESKALAADIYSELAEKGYKLSAKAANSYLFEYCSLITQAPEQSGQHYLFDESVPFYQTVLHGKTEYTCPAINLSENAEDTFLRAVETGAGLSFCLIYEQNTALMNTDLNLYSVNAEQWLQKAQEWYKRAESALSGCETAAITAHEKIADGVFRTEYSNGTAITVNYNQSAYTFGSVNVPARDFIVERN